LEQLTRAVWELRQELTGSVTEALLEQRWGAEEEQTRAPCPCCGRTVAARGGSQSHAGDHGGEGRLARPYFYCVSCGQGFAPLDAAWGGGAGSQAVPTCSAAAAKLTAEVPYETACELFCGLTGCN